MFQITKLSKTNVDFISTLNLSGKGRSISVSLALAKAIADGLSLPTTVVDSINSYYNAQNRIQVESFVSAVNEMCVIDVSSVLDYVLKFYTLRYNVCYPKRNILALNKETAIVDFFGISACIDPTAVACISECPIEMTDYVNKFTTIQQELQA